ncbi:MFS transporter [candidate division TA06 bacterium DG_26]|uniref:MFS transporter n=1 Tax=candidate division TA06 bacterium DG_26 TaxID=1703771 RepID=A0A0S7WL14_UNCT6|nr:MAG: MFS transporter [candidate division TA06 bacterium DG_26]
MRRLPKLERNVFYLGLVSLFTDFSTEMIYPLLPLFLSVTLGVDKAFIGVIEGVAESAASILKVFSGWLSDRLQRRRLLVGIGYSLSTFAKPLFAISHSGVHVLAIRMTDRIGKGIRTAPRDALIADSSPTQQRGRSFGFHRAMDTLGAVFGPLTAFILLPLFGNDYRTIFWLSLVPGIVAVLIILFLVRERKASASVKTEELTSRLLPRDFKVFVIIAAIFTLGNSSDAFLILRAQSLGIALGLIPLLWMFFNVIYSSTSIPGGMLSDRIGRRRTIVLALLVYSLIYFGFANAGRALHIWMLFGAYGLYYGLSEGVMRAYVADLVSVQFRATAYGVFHTAVGVAAFPASIIMGALWQFKGARIAFSFGAALALAAALLFLTLFRKKEEG